MKTLWARLAVTLTAAVLIGLSVLDVGFVFWIQAQERRAQRLLLYAAATHLHSATISQELVQALAARCRCVVTLRGGLATPTLASRNIALPPETPPGQVVETTLDGYQHLTVPLPQVAGQGGYTQAILSRPLEDALTAALKTNRRLLPSLAVVGLLMVVAGLFFLRRSLVQPLSRLVVLVGRHGGAAWMEAAAGNAGAIGRLSRAIVEMTQRLDDDKRRIAAQLAALQTAHQSLEDTHRHLVRASRLAVVGQLAAGLAHEIGNPLAVLAGFVEILRSTNTTPAEMEAALQRMAQELDRMHHTVRQLLDFSRPPQESVQLADIAVVLEHVGALLTPQEKLRGVTLSLPQIPNGTVHVAVEGSALTQVLLNLLLNAADAVKNRGHIRVSFHARENQRVELQLEDSGPGIPEDARQRIFEPFYTTKAPGRGTGLGLAVCERIIDHAGGDIVVGQSAALGGASFVVRLPRTRSPALAPTKPVFRDKRHEK